MMVYLSMLLLLCGPAQGQMTHPNEGTLGKLGSFDALDAMMPFFVTIFDVVVKRDLFVSTTIVLALDLGDLRRPGQW